MKFKATLPVLLVVALIMSSCSMPRNVVYFQDLDFGQLQNVQHAKEITVQPDDKLTIVVNSRDDELAKMFNLQLMTTRIGEVTSYSNNTQNMSCYTVGSDGDINFPVLGKIHVGGLSRMQIADKIQSQLRDKKLVNDAVVTVEFANLYISVLGEVKSPGRYAIDRDKLTLMDALGMAGDMTIYGKRDSVIVLRQDGDKQMAYSVNVTSAKDLYASPAYYLQQKDVVYVKPNNTRIRQSTLNGNTFQSSSFWISVASLVASMCAIIFK